jgi:four helix bundle protein
MQNIDLKDRTKTFAIKIVRLIRILPANLEGKVIGSQLLRSGTSVAANYRAVCRARSRAEFISKLGTVIEEADESCFWLELIIDIPLLKKELVNDLLTEANEIVSIMVASKNSATNNGKFSKK